MGISHEKPVPNLITEQCQKTHIASHHFDDNCRILDTAFVAWVDVTGAASVCQRSRSAKRNRESVVQVPRQVGDSPDCQILGSRKS